MSLQKVTPQIDWKKFLCLKNVKNTVALTYVIEDLHGEEINRTFYEKDFPRANQTEFILENIIKKKVKDYMSGGKIMIIHLIAGLIKKSHYMK